ncbi:MAG TPA: hypothetical protein VFO55_09435 [Gemmatimonadaceae bacterium]|nr:hypothetical protein [Gemmatimonadaceae bacterium]
MGIGRLVTMMLFGASALAGPAGAQSGSTQGVEPIPRSAFWVTVGMGGGHMRDAGMLSASLGLSGSRGRRMVSARGLLATDLATTHNEVAVLGGIRGPSRSFLNAMAGLAYGTRSYDFSAGRENRSGAGLALELGAHAATKVIGLGAKVFGTIGSRHTSHASFAVSIEVGNFGSRGNGR